MSATPHPVCIACEEREVGLYDLVCGTCRPQLEAAGFFTTSPTTTHAEAAADQRIPVGPTDV